MTQQNSLRIGVDIGGTFTDLVAFDDAKRQMLIAKTPSVPGNYSAGVINALDEIGTPRRIGVAPHGANRRDSGQLCQDIRRPHVARMQDVVDIREHVEDLGPEQPVRVGDDAEAHARVSRRARRRPRRRAGAPRRSRGPRRGAAAR